MYSSPSWSKSSLIQSLARLRQFLCVVGTCAERVLPIAPSGRSPCSSCPSMPLAPPNTSGRAAEAAALRRRVSGLLAADVPVAVEAIMQFCPGHWESLRS